MKRWVFWFLYLTPPAILVAVGIAEIAARYLPWLAAQVGHAPLWLSALLILFGVFYASVPYLEHLRRRVRRITPSRADPG